MKFVQKRNDCKVNLLYCNCQQMAIKQEGVLSKGVVRDRVRMLGFFCPNSNSQRLTYTQELAEFPQPWASLPRRRS